MPDKPPPLMFRFPAVVTALCGAPRRADVECPIVHRPGFTVPLDRHPPAVTTALLELLGTESPRLYALLCTRVPRVAARLLASLQGHITRIGVNLRDEPDPTDVPDTVYGYLGVDLLGDPLGTAMRRPLPEIMPWFAVLGRRCTLQLYLEPPK